jgi:hypothetical protein
MYQWIGWWAITLWSWGLGVHKQESVLKIDQNWEQKYAKDSPKYTGNPPCFPFDTNNLLILIFSLHFGWEDSKHLYSLLILCTFKMNKLSLYALTLKGIKS